VPTIPLGSGMIRGGRLAQDVDHVVCSGGRVDQGEAQSSSPLPHSRNTQDQPLVRQARGPAVIVLFGKSGSLENEYGQFRLEQKVKGGHGPDPVRYRARRGQGLLDRLGVAVSAVHRQTEPEWQAAGPARQVNGEVGGVPHLAVDGVEVTGVLGMRRPG